MFSIGHRKQKVTDVKLHGELSAIVQALQPPSHKPSHLVQQGFSPAACAVLLNSSLAFSLRSLLQNDSLMDIGSRRLLYNELLALLRLLGASMDLVPLLQMRVLTPNDDDDDADDDAEQARLRAKIVSFE